MSIATDPVIDAELRGVVHQVGDLRAPDLVLAGQAVDVGAGAADPAALDHGRAAPGSRHVPGQILAALPAAKDEGFEPFRLRHGYLLSSRTSSGVISLKSGGK